MGYRLEKPTANGQQPKVKVLELLRIDYQIKVVNLRRKWHKHTSKARESFKIK